MLWSIALSPDERRLMAGDDKKVKIWDIASQQEVAELPGHKRAIVDLAFWPDGNTIVSVSKDVVHLWRAASFDETDAPIAGGGGIRTEKIENQQNQTR